MTIEMPQAKLCPFCQKDNKCGMSNNTSAGICWCFEANFQKKIFDLLPPSREKECICEKCLVEFKLGSD